MLLVLVLEAVLTLSFVLIDVRWVYVLTKVLVLVLLVTEVRPRLAAGAARREGVWARQRAGGARQRQLQWAGGAAAGQPGGQVCGPVQVKATAVQLQTHLAPPHG